MERTDWRCDWAAAEEAQLDASLSATPGERLAWLEEAMRFAWSAGAWPEEPETPGLEPGDPGSTAAASTSRRDVP